jgi:hypothetical protein
MALCNFHDRGGPKIAGRRADHFAPGQPDGLATLHARPPDLKDDANLARGQMEDKFTSHGGRGPEYFTHNSTLRSTTGIASFINLYF